MYVPAVYAEPRVDVMLDFIAEHPFGILVGATSRGLEASHIPFVLDRAHGAHGTLRAHVARANPHAALADGSPCLVIFSGPEAYITPSWYATKREHGKVVPTWNYVAVHATGTVRRMSDGELRAHLEALTDQQESPRVHPWRVDDAPEPFIANTMRAIVGFDIGIETLEGKWKVSQNRSDADMQGVVDGLAQSGEPRDLEMARLVDAFRSR
ncbi:MAG TPA: FMN-binding negative transcriptional regulator [Gemmatimonadaceae bacterium]|nr:FMN-binding negative transcriptional regulator [Gemmatimonadaceae bacterium]